MNELIKKLEDRVFAATFSVIAFLSALDQIYLTMWRADTVIRNRAAFIAYLALQGITGVTILIVSLKRISGKKALPFFLPLVLSEGIPAFIEGKSLIELVRSDEEGLGKLLFWICGPFIFGSIIAAIAAFVNCLKNGEKALALLILALYFGASGVILTADSFSYPSQSVTIMHNANYVFIFAAILFLPFENAKKEGTVYYDPYE